MTISITLTPEEERTLRDLARQSGTDPASYVHEVVVAYLRGARDAEGKTFEQILAPSWDGWRHSGMTDGQIDELFERELREVRRERRPGDRPPGSSSITSRPAASPST